MKKRVIACFLIASMLFAALPVCVSAKTADQIEEQITATYREALSRADKTSFKGYCGSFVNWHLLILGINTSTVAGDGNKQFDNYKNLTVSSGGYPITAYSAKNYTLKSALNRITKYGTEDAYNILVGFQRTNTSPQYGHAFFIHAILDGIVYYSESFNATIDGTCYREGSVIACTIDELATYYGYWATFEGVIHFGLKYPAEMTLTGLEMPDSMIEGTAPVLTGNVEYCDTIEWMWAGIDSKGTWDHITQAQCTPGSNTYCIDDLLAQLDFAGLPAGEYTLKVEATGGGQYWKLCALDFTVEESWMNAAVPELPDILVQGTSPSVGGTITSNRVITWVWAGIDEHDTGLNVMETEWDPMTYQYNLGNITGDLDFAGLEPGEYTYRVEGVSGDQHYVLYEKEFTVFWPSEEHPFADVQTDDYCNDPVLWAVENGITQGATGITFEPGENCTRAQVVTFLWRSAGEPEPTVTEHPFTDVKEGAYYYDAMLWAVEQGITSGTGADTFSPNAFCSRGQVVTFLWRSAGENEPAGMEHPFTDVNEGKFYYTPMLWAVENAITSGVDDTTFAPDASCTRGQVVTFLYRAYAE